MAVEVLVTSQLLFVSFFSVQRFISNYYPRFVSIFFVYIFLFLFNYVCLLILFNWHNISGHLVYTKYVVTGEVEYFKSIIHTMLPITPMKTKNFWTHYEMSYECEKCKRKYRHKSTYRRHVTYECGKEPMFRCPFLDCTYKAYQKTHTDAHIKTKHKILALEYKWYQQKLVKDIFLYCDTNR